MSGSWDRPVQRAARLLLGLVLFGLALALLVKADLGLDPWNVFNQGVARHLGLTLGEVTVAGSLLLMVAWIPLRQRPGVGDPWHETHLRVDAIEPWTIRLDGRRI